MRKTRFFGSWFCGEAFEAPAFFGFGQLCFGGFHTFQKELPQKEGLHKKVFPTHTVPHWETFIRLLCSRLDSLFFDHWVCLITFGFSDQKYTGISHKLMFPGPWLESKSKPRQWSPRCRWAVVALCRQVSCRLMTLMERS